MTIFLASVKMPLITTDLIVYQNEHKMFQDSKFSSQYDLIPSLS